MNLEAGQTVHLCGVARIKVVRGRVEVLGAVFDAESNAQVIYSPRCNALLSVHALEASAVSLESCPEDHFWMHSNDALSYMESNPGIFRNLFCFDVSEKDKAATFTVVTRDQLGECCNAGLLQIPEMWRAVSTSLEGVEDLRVMVCGDRKIGKSTFVRFLANAFLTRPSADYLWHVDLDSGQTEFVPAGSVTAVRLCKESLILGPPFTHQRIPEASFCLGCTSPSDGLDRYIKGLMHVHRQIEDLNPKKTGMVINTMGWIEGLGLECLRLAIHVFRPTHLIHLYSNDADKDSSTFFDSVLKPPQFNSVCFKFSPMTCKMSAVPAIASGKSSWSPSEQRAIVQAIYLHLRDDCLWLSPENLSVRPFYRIRWRDFNILVLRDGRVSKCFDTAGAVVPDLLNCSLVALLDPRDAFVGYAACRYADSEYACLVTPLSLSTLESRIATIFIGRACSLPARLLLCTMAPDSTGIPPFLCPNSSFEEAAAAKPRRNLLRRSLGQ